MSATALLWLCTVAGLAVLSFKRPAYAAALYLATFFMFPSSWWWGQDLPDLRWNLSAGVVLLLSAVVGKMQPDGPPAKDSAALSMLAMVMLGNAVIVHLLMAPNPAVSLESLTLYGKFVLLFFLFRMSIRDDRDIGIVIWAMALGAAYIG